MFAKLHKSPLLKAYIVKGTVSGLKQFLATESFLFHLKSSFRAHDIEMFVLTFWSCMKAPGSVRQR